MASSLGLVAQAHVAASGSARSAALAELDAAPRASGPALLLQAGSPLPLKPQSMSAAGCFSSAMMGTRVGFGVAATPSPYLTTAQRVLPAITCMASRDSHPGPVNAFGSGTYVADGAAVASSPFAPGRYLTTQGAGFSNEEDEEDEEDDSEYETEEDEDSDEENVVHVNVHQEPKDELRIENLGLKKVLEDGLLKRGIERLFPIQQAVMAPSFEGRDIIARAKTGTGKTLAFGIPIMQRILEEMETRGRRASRGPRCLVLAPTRELAKQVEREFVETLPALDTVCVYGGVSMEMQIRQIRKGIDVVVGTPGRLMDLLDRGALKLEDVQFVVLDEADQMLAVGFEEDVEKIMESVPSADKRQTCLFSATMPGWVKKLSRKYLKHPLTIDLVGEQEDKLAENIRLMCLKVPRASKRALLNDIITVHGRGAKTIVFCATKRDADDVAENLGRAVGCEALHGDIAQAQRERTLAAFREGRFPVLVATDVAARGLDIPNVDLVVHYEIPNDPESFVHRSGRTGRAGKSGSAILMYTDAQLRTMRMIERDVGCKFEKIGVPSTNEVLTASADRVAESLNSVHPELADVFLGTAEKLLAEKGPLALAAAIASLSGFNKPPVARSLLTHEEGYATVRMVRTSRSRAPRLASARQVLGTLAEMYRPAADSVGKIRLLRSDKEEGAVFDLPEPVAKEFLSLKLDNGDVFDIPSELPPIEEEEDRGRDRYGELKAGGSGRGRGSRDRDSFGGRDSDRGRGGDRGRGAWARGGGGGGGGGGGAFRSGSRDMAGGARSTSPWGGARGRSSERRSGSADSWAGDSKGGDSWSSQNVRGGRSSSDSRPSWGSDRSKFSGVCFLCKQPGHRAADCPVVSGN